MAFSSIFTNLIFKSAALYWRTN